MKQNNIYNFFYIIFFFEKTKFIIKKLFCQKIVFLTIVTGSVKQSGVQILIKVAST
jgi:hypothetical protein